jgi:3-methyl-2-oxobutanoate hydroxymethyltransferase
VGLNPQTAGALGGFKMQGKDAQAAKQIIDDARALEAAGVFSIILEAVPAPLGKLVAETVQVPVIGIGAGPDVDGQVLVTHDMIGLFDKFVPRFVKQYANIRSTILEALAAYKSEVVGGGFPGPEHSFKMPAEALERLKKMIAEDAPAS